MLERKIAIQQGRECCSWAFGATVDFQMHEIIQCHSHTHRAVLSFYMALLEQDVIMVWALSLTPVEKQSQ